MEHGHAKGFDFPAFFFDLDFLIPVCPDLGRTTLQVASPYHPDPHTAIRSAVGHNQHWIRRSHVQPLAVVQPGAVAFLVRPDDIKIARSFPVVTERRLLIHPFPFFPVEEPRLASFHRYNKVRLEPLPRFRLVEHQPQGVAFLLGARPQEGLVMPVVLAVRIALHVREEIGAMWKCL